MGDFPKAPVLGLHLIIEVRALSLSLIDPGIKAYSLSLSVLESDCSI